MKNQDRLLLIDRICDEFESALQQGAPVSIEQALDLVKLESQDRELVDELFLELVGLRIVYSDNRDAEAASLKSKYPEKSKDIDSAIQQRSLLGTVANASVQTEIGTAKPGGERGHSINQIGNRFENLKHLASGGLGDVYTGHDKAVQRLVAVKLLKPAFVTNPEAKRRFLNEGAITGMLEHPGIVPVYDSGMTNDGQPYYAMRLLEGQTLKQAIKKLHSNRDATGFDAEQRSLLRRLAQVCDAISFAHDRGVIHRDLKPANILLGEFGETVVIDWGLARQTQSDAEGSEDGSSKDLVSARQSNLDPLNDSATKIGSVLGTPEYMSPEQATGDSSKIGKQSDVYSLGAVLYSILTGTSPNGGHEIVTQDRIEAAKQADFPTAIERYPQVPAALNSICKRAMKVDADLRYDSPKTLASEIDNWLNDHPVQAHPDNLLETFSRFLRKHRRWSAAAAATLVAITVGSVVATSVISSQRTKLEKRKTEAEDLSLEARQWSASNLNYMDFMGAAFEKLRSKNYLESAVKKNASISDFADAMTTELELWDERLDVKTKRHILGNLVSALNAAGRNQEALEVTQEFVDATTELYGEEISAGLIDAKGALVYSLVQNSKFEEALTTADETLALIDSDTSQDDRAQEIKRSVQNNQIRSFQALRRWSEAIAIREDLYPWLKDLDVNNLPKSQDQLSIANQYIDDRSQADDVPNLLLWQQKLYDAQKEFGGAKDPKTLASLHRMSQAIEREQGPAAAIPYREDLVELATEVLGAEHRNTMTSKSNLAGAYQSTGRFEEATELYSELHDFRLKNNSIRYALLNRMMIGEVQLCQRRPKQALETFEDVIERAESAPEFGPEAVFTFNVKFRWLLALLEVGQFEQVIAAINEKSMLPTMLDDPQTNFKFYLSLQFAHLLNGDFESALLQRKHLPTEVNSANAIVVIQIAEALCLAGRENEAREMLEQMLEWPPSASKMPAIVDSLKCHVSHAKGLLAGIISETNPERAEQLYLEAISEFEAGYHVKSQTARVQSPMKKHMEGLIGFYKAAGNKKQAGNWRKKLEQLKSQL